jgi:hypothetical protein
MALTPSLSLLPTYLIIDQSGQWQVIEQVGEELPHVGVPVFPQALIVEPIDLRNLPRLVVPPQDGDSISISQLERDEQGDGLDRVVPSIDIISHEEVICIGRVSADPEEFR